MLIQCFSLELMLTDNLLEDLVKKINEYADKTINRNQPLHCTAMWNSWAEFFIDEIRKFIGLIFSTGLISMPSNKKYWSRDLLFKNEHFPSFPLISRGRFKSIMQFFNFKEKLLFENDRLRRLWVRLDHLNKVIFDKVTPGKIF